MSHPSAAFHFVFLVWKVPLPNIKCLSLSFLCCMKFSITRAEIPTAHPLPTRQIHQWGGCISETFSLFPLCIPSSLICTKSHCFFFISFSTCSSPVQRVLCRVKGNCAEEGCWGLSEHHDLSLPLWEADLSWGKKIKDADFTASHFSYTNGNLHMQSSNGQLMCDFHFFHLVVGGYFFIFLILQVIWGGWNMEWATCGWLKFQIL